MATFAALSMWLDKDGPWPVQTAVVLSGICSGFILLGVWLTLLYYRYRLFITDSELRQVGVITERRVQLKLVDEIKWRRFPQGGSVRITDPFDALTIELDNFTENDRNALIAFCRQAMVDRQQIGWDAFSQQFADTPQKRERSRRSRRVLAAFFIVHAVAFFIVWLVGLGVAALLASLINAAYGIHLLRADLMEQRERQGRTIPTRLSNSPRSWLLVGLISAPLGGLTAVPVQAADAERPNLVLILADDLGWADLPSYGNRFHETPHLDRLAQQGIRFTQFYAGPVCSPTRANLQSGLDQARLGITQHIPGHRRPFARLVDPPVAPHLPLEIETVAERLRTVGYRTGYFGKWHLGGVGYGAAQQGWETVLETQGNTVPQRLAPADPPRRTAEFLTEKAVEFMAKYQDEPFLLQVSHFAVHIPLSTTPERLRKYQAKPPMPGFPSRPDYAGLLEELDESVGGIVAAVDRLGLAEKTLIVFVSDNGGLETQQDGTIVTSNRPLRSEKGTLYEGGIRVPCIARWPGVIPPATVSEAIAATVDFYPTFLALSAASAADDQPLDGVDLSPVLRDPDAELARDALYWHLPHYHHSTPASAVRQGEWKLIEFFEDGALELYHLQDDLGEANNLAESESERAQAMQASLQAWRQRVDAQMPQPNPDYDPQRAGELARPARR